MLGRMSSRRRGWFLTLGGVHDENIYYTRKEHSAAAPFSIAHGRRRSLQGTVRRIYICSIIGLVGWPGG